MSTKDAAAKPAAPPKRSSFGKIIGMIFLALAILVAGFFGYVATLPNDFKIVRSTTINAPPDVVFAQLNDFHKWDAWSPWAKRDPNAKNTFEGPTSGKDSKFSWSGNGEVGEGWMTILDSQPPEHLHIELGFTKPMQDTSDVFFDLKPKGDGTNLSWTMSGEHPNIMSKAMCFVMNMDKMLGGDFEKGLASIKDVAEKEAAAAEEGKR
jgi:uncharacterized protein YndB with AHSA1/START domain